MDRVAIKNLAKEKIKGNLWTLWKPALILGICTGVLSWATQLIPGIVGQILYVIVSLVLCVAAGGYVIFVLKFTRGENPTMNDIIECAKERWGTILVAGIVTGLIVFLWSLLLIIPGIIAAFSYAMVSFIVVDSNMGAMDCLKKSKEIMNGHKMDYFVFQLSFIGWHMLASLTLGILYIWLIPYISVATTLFYESLNGGVNQNTVVENEVIKE